MNLVEVLVFRWERWIASVEREMDLTSRQLGSPLRRRDDDRVALEERLKMLELELADARVELQQLTSLRTSARAMFAIRPARQWPPLPSAAAMARAEIRQQQRKRA